MVRGRNKREGVGRTWLAWSFIIQNLSTDYLIVVLLSRRIVGAGTLINLLPDQPNRQEMSEAQLFFKIISFSMTFVTRYKKSLLLQKLDIVFTFLSLHLFCNWKSKKFWTNTNWSSAQRNTREKHRRTDASILSPFQDGGRYYAVINVKSETFFMISIFRY